MTDSFKIRNRIIILGDQLDIESLALKNFDFKHDEVWMAEVKNESTHVPSHLARSTLFLSAMRHFAEELKERNYPTRYLKIDSSKSFENFTSALLHTHKLFPSEKLIIVEPGDFRVLQELRNFSQKYSIELEILRDESFLISKEDFNKFAQSRSGLRMEYFYRWMRAKTGILMKNGKPAGGSWNFDKSNRKPFGKEGPKKKQRNLSFNPDTITKEVIEIVAKTFPNNPGTLKNFGWPVKRSEALKALKHFVRYHLAEFGPNQDAMWSSDPFLHHSLLSAALNLKLLRPIEVIEAAEDAYNNGKASIESVEGFIRQILGWREYVRGIYWLYMPEYLERNKLNANLKLPWFYWTGETSMNCLKQVIKQTLDYGYAHHIQRLMVTGLYGLLLGVHPKEMHQWYLAVYVDAVEWVELPNTLGMSQFGDGGVMASKPYIATGKYINRMSNYCQSCVYSPDNAYGEKACPFTTLFWDFVARHRDILKRNPRLGAQVNNWNRFPESTQIAIRKRAALIRKNNASGELMNG